ncbi:unnamed protein product [Hyaloperonospora brassicae]|uniref:Myb/SANT-like domain-containing protein n=1 Tax=Hyaloperonospora brassicae TaxID=162125 RepID=A0AAV0USA0_HYABA|nr:unnamed protein product [Hyaloperonospora brassicae]
MASSEDASAPRLNVWTPKEFRDLVKAWELALARPQATTDRPESLHDTVYDQFVALCGGHSRRNKAALTSKRSALKFSYLHVRDFNRSQSRHKAKLFFDLSEKERRSILKQFKKTNSNVLDISREMYKALERIIRQGGGDDDAAVLPGTRPKEEEDRSARTETRTKRTSSVNWTVQQTAPGDKMADKPAAGSRYSTTPASSSTTCTARSSSLNADTSTSIWSVDEMRQLVKAWGIAVQLVCANSTGQSMSIIQELGRQFELLQEGKSGCNLQGLATRRRALKLSYTRISAFDKIQEMNGDVAFAKLPLPTRQTLIKSWKNANLLDLPADIYSELTKVIPLDTRAIALEDMRRAKAGEPVSVGGGRSGRKQGKPLKQPRIVRSAQDSNGEESRRVAAVQPPLVAVDSEEEKAGVVRMVVHSRLSLNDEEKDADPSARNARLTEKNTLSVRVEDDARQASAGGDRNATSTARLGIDEMVRSTTEDNVSSGPRSNATLTSCSPRKLSSVSVVPLAEGDCENAGKTTRSDGESCGDTPGHAELSRDQLMMDKVVSAGSTPGIEKIELSTMDPCRQATVSEPLTTKLNQCAAAVDGVALDNCESTPQNERPCVATTPADGKADAQKLAKKKRKLRVDGPKGLLWENSELQILIHAWERASILMCNSDPAERLSLNKEMYREFVQMQGGSSVRNSTALAARRSSLKFSYAHIESFDKAQEAKGEPCYHEIPEDKRMALLRSWKNRNSVDLTKEMYDGLGRILAMDEQLARVRSLRPPPLLKFKKKADSPEEAKHSVLGPDASHLFKAAKWTTEESSDLIKACADVMNFPSDQEQSPTKRESLIYDAFVTRRQNAGDTEIPFRRDLRSMAQQWRYILASYSYIRACNDNCSEGESPSWFDMSPVQKRAYQQCTNVPAKFVDLDAEMFALVTKTSFMGEAAISPPSPVVKGVTEGISLRPRSMRKRTEAFWSSDSDSSVNSLPRAKRTSKKSPVVSAGKKVTNWPVEEIWELIRAWDEVSRVMGNCRLSLTLDETFALFTKAQDGPPIHGRTHSSVRNKLIALKSSYSKITAYISERGDSSAWFDMPRAERMIEIRSWKKKTIIDLGRDMYDALKQIVLIGGNGVRGKRTIRKLDRPPTSPPASFGSKDPIEQDRKDHAWQKPEKSVVANWSKEELLMLGEACGELLEGRRSRRYVFEEEKDRFFRRYEELGGTNSPTAAVGLARFVLDSYEFIYFYDQKAAERDSLFWFELDVADREQIVARMGKTYRSFNGLSTVDKDIFDVIDGIDAELRVTLGETKKKTYKPPNDASSRYVDIEAVVDQCEFQLRNGAAPTNPKAREASAESEASSSDEKADVSSSDSSSAEESAGSDSSAPVGVRSRRVTHSEEKVIRVPKHHVVRPGSNAAPSRATPPCKRKREAVAGASSTLYITEIIQKQNRKLEQAVKRFRKESADNRKKHHAFLVQKIQDSFPVDTGHGSYLERVAERQGQTLVVIFQKLQQHRDAEKAKDEELMRELFGQSGPS